ncbi:MAG: MltA domain-containing protein [Synechococcales cyanobacterium T60_A2020_003]|nr:MltA domain-containing protein [Synechococcales cyanobacterium T60_A2020_003]
MIRPFASLGLSLGLAFSSLVIPLPSARASDLPLRSVSLSDLSPEEQARFGLDDRLWGTASDRQALLTAINYSLNYLTTDKASEAYANYPVQGITRDRVRRSLERFRDLVQTSASAADLQAAILREFELYESVGNDGLGTVHFTGYFEPIYAASRVPTADYRYPLYRRPPTLEQWTDPHPTRIQLEGTDGLQGSQGPLRGLELVWLRDRLEAFLVQVQGSARLQLTDGTMMSVSYHGRTNYDYTSLGRELVNAGIYTLDELTLPLVIQYFKDHPEALSTYIPRNNRFVFFRETDGGAPNGTLEFPVTAERTVATDKAIMPMGALAIIHLDLPIVAADASLETRPVSRFVLNQDTGGAIQGPGRVDLFMGTGSIAGDRAGLMNSDGQLYFLLLKE